MRIIRMGWTGGACHRVLIASRQPLPIEALVADITGERHPIFALSLGNQPAVRKLTVQVTRPDGQILGYMKLPLTDRATERVRHEAMNLERLWNFPALRPCIPQLLHAGIWNESYVLFQSAMPGEPGPRNLTEMHENCLQTLWSVNRIDRSGQSLVEEIGPKWDKAVVFLDSKWKELGQEVLRRSVQDLDRLTIRCGLSHGDFAPWNTRVQQGRLLLFDWESTDWEAPNSWDIFHFGSLTGASLNKGNRSGFSSEYGDRGSYLLYLLYSVMQFLHEENWEAIAYRRKLLLSELERTVHIRAEERVPETQAVRSIDRAGIGARILFSRACSAPRIVTTSWDDGNPLDIRIAELLRARGLSGTFYIPTLGVLGRKKITSHDLRALSSEGFEIGAHSVSHNNLSSLATDQLAYEVGVGKQMLEQIVGRSVAMFCYPNGRYNKEVIRHVQHAGYKGARTVRMLSMRTEFLPFEIPTTVQAYPHPSTAYIRNLAKAHDVPGLLRFMTTLRRCNSWVELGKQLFDEVLQKGGIWHLYGHSWEIDELGLWTDLRELLDYVSHREGVRYVNNGQLVF